MKRFLTLAAVSVTAFLPAQQAPIVEAPVKVQDAAKGVQTGVPGKSNSWFPNTDLDLGTYMNHEVARGTFKFKNPNDKPMDWKHMQGSCTCSRAMITVGGRTYEMTGKPTPGQIFRISKVNGSESREKVNLIQINPGEEGEVEVHMEMSGATGVKSATLDIHTTDPELPMAKLKFSATGAQMFVVSPAEVNLNTMTWNDKREFTATVISPISKDFNILRTDPVPQDFTVKYDKEVREGVATWTIRGTYGPMSTENGGGGVIKFYTDVKGDSSFQVRVLAMVKGPLEVTPGGFLTLGMIRKGTAKTEKVVFEPNDGLNLEATAVRFEKLSAPQQFISAKTSKDGNKLIVELLISADTPPGLVRGDMVVELNHPAMKEKRILFNGFVR